MRGFASKVQPRRSSFGGSRENILSATLVSLLVDGLIVQQLGTGFTLFDPLVAQKDTRT